MHILMVFGVLWLAAGIIALPILIINYAKTKAGSNALNGFRTNNTFQTGNQFQAGNTFQAGNSFQPGGTAQRKLNILRALIILDAIFLAAIISVIGFVMYKYKTEGSFLKSSGKYSESETLSSDSMTKDFVKTDYNVDGDNVVFDENNVKHTITGFYADPENEAISHGDAGSEYVTKLYDSYLVGGAAIEYKLENNSNYDVSVVVQCIGINGIASYNFGYSYETIKANSSITFYQDSFRVRDGVIKDFIIDILNIYVPYDGSNPATDETITFESHGIRKFTTTADYSYEKLELPGGSEPMYDDHGVRIYQAKLSAYSNDNKKLYLIIYNDTDDTAAISCENYKIDGKKNGESSLSIFYSEKIPSNYVFISDEVERAYVEDGEINWKEIELSISFKFDEYPEYDFSTGYIKARK